jgi:hypothetical protein
MAAADPESHGVAVFSLDGDLWSLGCRRRTDSSGLSKSVDQSRWPSPIRSPTGLRCSARNQPTPFGIGLVVVGWAADGDEERSRDWTHARMEFGGAAAA